MGQSQLIISAVCAVTLATPLAARETVHDFSGFTKVIAADDVNVRVFSGSDYRVVSDVSGTARERRLVVEQDGDTLVIKRKGGVSMILMGMADYYTVTVHMPELTSVIGRRGVDVEVSGKFTNTFEAMSSSGADVDIDGLETDTLFLKASSGSDLDVRGSCKTLVIEASSGSDIDGEDLECMDVQARASSGSDIKIHVSGSLFARASSGGDIKVEGAPMDVKVKESSGGEVSLPGS